MRDPKLRDFAAGIGLHVGCGDSGCIWGAPGGMATNGGCRCLVGEMVVRGTARALLRVAREALSVIAFERAAHETWKALADTREAALDAATKRLDAANAEVEKLRGDLAVHEDHCKRIDAIVHETGHRVCCEAADGVRSMANTIEELRERIAQQDHTIRAAAEYIRHVDQHGHSALGVSGRRNELRSALAALPKEES